MAAPPQPQCAHRSCLPFGGRWAASRTSTSPWRRRAARLLEPQASVLFADGPPGPVGPPGPPGLARSSHCLCGPGTECRRAPRRQRSPRVVLTSEGHCLRQRPGWQESPGSAGNARPGPGAEVGRNPS
ncbi:collagen alpha-1(II) chain-like [Panthera pardus]|uniref:Collagen alpha-1(II) chain-like n=1 Tax=Panthera pardus TaxID=9691 RepID=A0A9W2V6R3_PANPR|nr:collagen alpha-1(II) chain-like [Panthera pardus]